MESNLNMEKIDLKDCTFITPIKFDSYDREQNFKFVIKYITDKFDTNIILTEVSYDDNLLLNKKYKDIILNNNIKVIEKKKEKYFHRTKYINDMLNMVNTPITINYDIDVILPVQNYEEAANLIRNQKFDLVYPYSFGDFLFMVPQSYRDEMINDNLIKLEIKKLLKYESRYGHVQFFNTKSYKKGYGENENFISHGSEDIERFVRFTRFGYNVTHLKKNSFVFHLEHERLKDSNTKGHENSNNNIKLWDKIDAFTPQEHVEYCLKQDYIKKFTL
jgi:predicted glycosyltransferase involved in capsule biosynthesis